MIQIAREVRGITQSELAEKLKVSQTRVSKMEDGFHSFTQDDIARLSSALRFKPSFFYRKDVRREAFNGLYRKRKSLPVKFLTQFNTKIVLRTADIDILTKNVETEAAELPKCDPDDFRGGPKEIAGHIRQFFKLPPGPIKNLIDVVEDFGIIVVRFDFGTTKIDGLSMQTRDGRLIIFLNSLMPSSRQVFTLIHELAHLVMHRNDYPRSIEEMDKQSDEFAAEFATPDRDIRADFKACGYLTLDSILRLKLKWNISMAVIVRRARDLGFIDAARYTSLQVMMSQKGYRKNEPHEQYIRLGNPSLESEMIDHRMKESGYTDEDISDLVGIEVNDFRAEFQRHNSPFQVVK